jgi:hypothetical protein
LRHFYRDLGASLDRAMMIVGAARSGTTWVAELVASQSPTRIIFEPFYPQGVPEFRQYDSMMYVPPRAREPELRETIQKILCGQIRGHWVDHQVACLFPRQRLVKAVRANLMLGWLRKEFPQVPTVLMVRHPCAVVASRLETTWNPKDDLESIFGQTGLISDFSLARADLLKRNRRAEELHALVWCLQHLVPLTQVAPGEIHLLFYEDLCQHPEIEVPKLFAALNRSFDDSIYRFLERPSRMTSSKRLRSTPLERAVGWKDKLSADQQRRIQNVVNHFGLSHLYGSSAFPALDSRQAFLR